MNVNLNEFFYNFATLTFFFSIDTQDFEMKIPISMGIYPTFLGVLSFQLSESKYLEMKR